MSGENGYDSAKHAQLLDLKAKKEKELEAVSVELHDEYASDAWPGESGANKLVVYKAKQERHAQLTRELELILLEANHQETMRPRSVPEQKRNFMADIARRWMHSGANGLDDGERQTFLTGEDPPKEIRNILPAGARGDVFDPFALAGPRWTRRPRLAVGDPGRSDISTESAAGAGDAWGAAAPEEWAMGLVETLSYYGSVASSCHNFDTSTGNDWHQNQLDSSEEEGGAIVDQSQVAGTGVPATQHDQLGVIGDIVFKSYWRHSNFLSARLETFDDLHFDVAGRHMREMARRMGRGWNRWFTTGDNSSKPQGIVPSATIVDGGAGSADDGSGGVDYQNLLDLEYGIDLAYLMGNEGGDGGFTDAHGGMIGWMMNRNVERQLRLAVHPTSRLPIWLPNIEVGAGQQMKPNTILGYPYSINQHMADGKTNNDLPLLFGACGHYGVRNIGGPLYYRFWDSNTVTRFAVTFIAFSRRDGRCRGPLKSNLSDAYVVLQVKT